ncbi:hypothetical protein ACER0A_013780 [Haloimpatiens sp. FM7315]|uniref:hypothetical protein n=1 Tax=Haloimpatiens sp. FM7315 TaxID=3298609 RepID=UPI00370CE416
MRVLKKSIEVISYTDLKGEIYPLRFRIATKDETLKVIKINKILQRTTEKIAGNTMIVFRCQSLMKGTLKLFEIKYEISTCKWILYKI